MTDPNNTGRAHALRRRSDWVLGFDRRMRSRVAYQLLAWAVYLGCDAALLVGMALGVVPVSMGSTFIAFTLVAQLVIYLLLRSGLTDELEDPSLMLVQGLLALTMVAVGYAIAGPLRACALMLAVMVIVYAMFTLTPRQTLGLGAYAVASLGAVMLLMSWLDPQGYPAQQEAVHFGIVAASLPVAALLGQYVSGLNERLRTEQQELHDALDYAQELATRDALTGLVNRRHMLEIATLAIDHERRRGHAFCIALIDLDGFRAINDEHGSAVADDLLRAFARIATRTLRHSDVTARWGGDEFLILLTETHPDYALMGLKRRSSELQRAPVLQRLPALRLGFSAGLAAHRTGDTLERTLERAGLALQEAKDRGGASVVCHDGSRASVQADAAPGVAPTGGAA